MKRSNIKQNLDLNEFNFSIDQQRLESLHQQIRTEGTFFKGKTEVQYDSIKLDSAKDMYADAKNMPKCAEKVLRKLLCYAYIQKEGVDYK